MRVYAVNVATGTCYANKFRAVSPEAKNAGSCEADTFKRQPPNIATIAFKGYNVHIIDGGLHADTMTHFARGIMRTLNDVVEVTLHKAETNPNYSGIKQMDSVRDRLKYLNEKEIVKPGDFVAITGSAQVYLSTLADRMGLERNAIRPENVKSFKSKIIEFLSNEYYADRVDRNGQKLFAVPDVISEINKMVKNGVNVYLPSGHPIEFELKARAAQEGVKDDLYKMIYTRGKEGTSSITPIINELKEENVYKFNLLALSDAHIVNIRDLTGEKNYIFAAYDNCVNDGARGVFNFYPVRNKEGKILGYSFTDKKTIHYPYNEYPGNKYIEEISRFVGRKREDFSYEGNIVKIMAQLMAWEEPYDKLPDVLYPVTCYPKKRFIKENILEKGKFFNRTETLYFDMNDSREFTFPKCDCEGSGRPSVVPMWGSCFSSIYAIKRDIAAAIARNLPPYNRGRDLEPAKMLISDAVHSLKEGRVKTAEYQLNKAIKGLEPYKNVSETFESNVYANELLYDLLMKQKKYDAAEAIANRTINLKSRILLHNFKNAENIKSFSSLKFAHYWEYPTEEIEKFTKQTDNLALWFERVSWLCHRKGNENASELTKWAAGMIQNVYLGPIDELVERRANGHLNIGDIYNEYRTNFTSSL